eukprot:scaffold11726_cov112-Cylindrotheca_fusiformis.AAC.3
MSGPNNALVLWCLYFLALKGEVTNKTLFAFNHTYQVVTLSRPQSAKHIYAHTDGEALELDTKLDKWMTMIREDPKRCGSGTKRRSL